MKCNLCWNLLSKAHRVYATQCSHLICHECASKCFSKTLNCPICSTKLDSNGLAQLNMIPSPEKIKILCGLDPSSILQIASRAIEFYNFQQQLVNIHDAQELNNLRHQISHMNQQHDQTVKNLSFQISTLSSQLENAMSSSNSKNVHRPEVYSKSSLFESWENQLFEREKITSSSSKSPSSSSLSNANSIPSPFAIASTPTKFSKTSTKNVFAQEKSQSPKIDRFVLARRVNSPSVKHSEQEFNVGSTSNNDQKQEIQKPNKLFLQRPETPLLHKLSGFCSNINFNSDSFNGELFVWGSNENYEFGNGRHQILNTPNLVSFPSKYRIRLVHGGQYHAFFVTEENHIFSQGKNQFGQCGVGRRCDYIKYATHVTKIQEKNITQIVSGAFHTHFVVSKQDNDVIYSVGSNAFGQMGISRYTSFHTHPTLCDVNIKGRVRMLASGSFHSILITEKNDVYVWGRNNAGQLGINVCSCIFKPRKCLNWFPNAIENLVCGYEHTAIVTLQGLVYQCGSNSHKQFGSMLIPGSATKDFVQIKLSTNTKVKHLAINHNCTVAASEKGEVWIWGSRNQVVSSTGLKESPEMIWKSNFHIKSLHLGRLHLHLITCKGNLYTWLLVSSPSVYSNSPFKPQERVCKTIRESRSSLVSNKKDGLRHLHHGKRRKIRGEFEKGSYVPSSRMSLIELGVNTNCGEEGSSMKMATRDRRSVEMDRYTRCTQNFNQSICTSYNINLNNNNNGNGFAKKPWLCYHLTDQVKMVSLCGYNTFILFNSMHYGYDFLPLVNSESSKEKLLMRDGSVLWYDLYWVLSRAPKLLKYLNILSQASVHLVKLILQNLYTGYYLVSWLLPEDLCDLTVLLESIEYTHTELYAAVIGSRNKLTSSGLSDTLKEQHLAQYKKDMKKMYESKENCDFCITSNTGEAYWVHRGILMCRSVFYYGMFTCRMKESECSTYQIDTDGSIIDEFLRYFYYDFSDFSAETVEWLLENMDIYFLNTLNPGLRRKLLEIQKNVVSRRVDESCIFKSVESKKIKKQLKSVFKPTKTKGTAILVR